MLSRAVFLAAACAAAPLTPGSLVALRLSAASSSASVAGFIDEFSGTGTLLQTIALPAASFSLAADGSSGALAFSEDGARLLVGGFAAPAGSPAIAFTNSSSAPRAVASVSAASGAVNARFRAIPRAFSGDGAAAAGGLQSVCDGGDDLYATGADAGARAGARVAILDDDGRGSARDVFAGGFASCLVASDRLLAVAANGSVVALEDLHSATPGLPDDARSADFAFAPTARFVTDARSAAGRALAIGGGSGASGARLWLAHGAAAPCLTVWTINDFTPTAYEAWPGWYLDAGDDVALQFSTRAEAERVCDAIENCTGCVARRRRPRSRAPRAAPLTARAAAALPPAGTRSSAPRRCSPPTRPGSA